MQLDIGSVYYFDGCQFFSYILQLYFNNVGVEGNEYFWIDVIVFQREVVLCKDKVYIC